MLENTAGSLAIPVSTHSIRYRILKDRLSLTRRPTAPGFNPFDPIQDTERDVIGG